MTLYLDVIWLLNFLFDSLLLFLTAGLLRREIRKRNIFAAGFLGSLIIWAPLLPFTTFLLTPIGKVLISAMMILIAFGYQSLRNFFINWMTFYLCTFAAGGALFGIHYLLLSGDHYTFLAGTISSFGDPISWFFVLIIFPLVLFFSRGTMEQFVTMKIRYDQMIDVAIVINGEKIPLKGLIDSGNHLQDPLTKKPVMIVSLEKTARLFPGELLQVFENIHHLATLDEELLQKWRIAVIPYRVVGQENRMLAAIQPDKVEFRHNDQILVTERVLVAFVSQHLSHHFDCIVHPQMVHEAIVKHVS